MARFRSCASNQTQPENYIPLLRGLCRRSDVVQEKATYIARFYCSTTVLLCILRRIFSKDPYIKAEFRTTWLMILMRRFNSGILVFCDVRTQFFFSFVLNPQNCWNLRFVAVPFLLCLLKLIFEANIFCFFADAAVVVVKVLCSLIKLFKFSTYTNLDLFSVTLN